MWTRLRNLLPQLIRFWNSLPRLAQWAVVAIPLLGAVLLLGSYRSHTRDRETKQPVEWAHERIDRLSSSLKRELAGARKSAENAAADYLHEADSTPSGSRFLDRRIRDFVNKHRTLDEVELYATPQPKGQPNPGELYFYDPQMNQYLAVREDGSQVWVVQVASRRAERPWWFYALVVLSAAGLVASFVGGGVYFIRRRRRTKQHTGAVEPERGDE